MDHKNPPAEIAAGYVNNTGRHIFLTGKAGTGKTTFLKDIRNNTHKNCIVAAPTGVAAINAGGVTLHSLLQMPFGSFIPSDAANLPPEEGNRLNTPASVRKNMRFNKAKLQMLREMELLIIDEVSMLRADILDAMDTVLRTVRRNRGQPFGGVQLLLIGDMLQLPPVVKNSEWPYLSPYYNSIYFFDALALQSQKPVFIEMEKIFRQTGERFIRLLNHLRDNCLTEEDIELMNNYYDPSLADNVKKGAVFLTTHNYQADNINKQQLKKLPGKQYHFNARITGDFPDYNYPVDEQLFLKKDAQVMFIKNDYSGENRYYNGKIGTVENVDENGITVRFDDDTPSVEVESYMWENKRFKLNPETGEIEEKTIGTFEHLPIKLAWAITIHKSQGLTFDKAIIDASKAFAPGQVYVALSRLSSLDGLILNRPLPSSGLSPDERLALFARNNKQPTQTLQEQLKQESFRYVQEFILQAFNFTKLQRELQDHLSSYNKEKGKSRKQDHRAWAGKIVKEMDEPEKTAEKFRKQLQQMFVQQEDMHKVRERMIAAKDYFEPKVKALSDEIRSHINHVSGDKGMKTYINELKHLDSIFYLKLKEFYKAIALLDSLKKNTQLTQGTMDKITKHLEQERPSKEEKKSGKAGKKKEKKPKIPTVEISYKLYLDGKTIEEIARARELAISTIEGHMAKNVAKGLLPAGDFVDKTKMEQIIKAYKAVGSTKLNDIKAVLGDEFTYSDIRYAMAEYFCENNSKEKS